MLFPIYFSYQRVNQCLQDTCSAAPNNFNCSTLIDCGRGHAIQSHARQQWVDDNDSSACFNTDGDFDYGIYQKTVLLTTKSSAVKRYIYSLFWGFQVPKHMHANNNCSMMLTCL